MFQKGRSGNPRGLKKGTKQAKTLLKQAVEASAVLKIDESELVENIRTASRRDWRAAAWILERVNPKRWGPNAQPQTLLNTSIEDLQTLILEVVQDAKRTAAR